VDLLYILFLQRQDVDWQRVSLGPSTVTVLLVSKGTTGKTVPSGWTAVAEKTTLSKFCSSFSATCVSRRQPVCGGGLGNRSNAVSKFISDVCMYVCMYVIFIRCDKRTSNNKHKKQCWANTWSLYYTETNVNYIREQPINSHVSSVNDISSAYRHIDHHRSSKISKATTEQQLALVKVRISPPTLHYTIGTVHALRCNWFS